MGKISELQYLAVGKNGSYATSGRYQSSPSQLTRIVRHIKDQGIQELTFYFHGGLVSEGSAETSIQRVFHALDNSQLTSTHTLACIWKTDLLTTIKENIREIFDTSFGKHLMMWVIRAVTKKIKLDSSKSPGSASGLTLEEIEQEWINATSETRIPFRDLQFDVATKAKGTAVQGITEDDGELITIIAAEIEDHYKDVADPFESWGEVPGKVTVDKQLTETFHTNEPRTKGWFSGIKIAHAVVKVAARVIKRYIKDTDHGLQATVVEEICRAYFISDIGQWVWGEMKEKAKEMWQTDGAVGFDFISQLQQEMPGLKLNLVGHSAGAICIANLMKKIRDEQWNVNVNKIMWWAPACSCEVFKQEIIDHQESFSDFRMITMRDAYELNDNLVNGVPWLYPSSLLYFISGVLESEADYPIAGMTRYHSARQPHTGDLFDSIKEFFQPRERRVLSKTPDGAPLGFRSHAIDHGEFTEDTLTLESLTAYIEVGASYARDKPE